MPIAEAGEKVRGGNDVEEKLSPGDQRGARSGDGARPSRHHHGRGHFGGHRHARRPGRLGRAARRHQGPASEIRAGARARHAPRRDQLRRRGGGRRGHRAAPRRRADVRRLHGRLLRPDFQSGRKVPLHVRRQGGDALSGAHHVRRRLPRRLAALAVPLPDLHPHPRPEGRAALQRLRGEGPSHTGDPRRRSGDLLRAQGHVRHGDGGARRALHHPLRRGERHPRRATT